MSHCGTPAFYYHFSHGFIVFREVEHRTKKERLRVRRNIINITQLKLVVPGWNFGLVLALLV